MNKFTFDDLLKEPHQRVMEFEVDGLGVVTLTELTSIELDKIEDDSRELGLIEKRLNDLVASGDASDEDVKALNDEVSEKNELHIARWVARFLSGRKCNAKEVAHIRKNLSQAVRRRIYFTGIGFNVEKDAYREVIEKNS